MILIMKNTLILIFIICFGFTYAQGQTAFEYVLQGGEKYEEGDYRGAIRMFDKAIELNYKFAEAYFLRGSVIC